MIDKNRFSETEILFLIPPFQSIERPSIGVHILDTIAKDHSIKTKIFYSNLILAQLLGAKNYSDLSSSPMRLMLGEAFFSIINRKKTVGFVAEYLNYTQDEIIEFRRIYFEKTIETIFEIQPRIIACPINFQQVNVVFTLMAEIKKRKPKTINIVGGSGIQEDTVTPLKHLADNYFSKCVDHFFVGEAEYSFAKYLDLYKRKKNIEQILKSELEFDLDETAPCDYRVYFDQLSHYFPEEKLEIIRLPFETSRGCYHQLVSHCKFCGLNCNLNSYRVRNISKSIDLIKDLVSNHPTKNIDIIDSILPKHYFSTFFKIIKKYKLSLFFEQKVPLDFRQASLLKESGAMSIQPGIETLSTRLLHLMGKGVTLKENIELLKNCLLNKIYVQWNLLHGVPGECEDDYIQMKDIIQLIEHLNPPSGFFPISIVRYSPYYEKSEKFGIKNVRPFKRYFHCFPKDAKVSGFASHFEGDYSRLQLVNNPLYDFIEKLVYRWRHSWANSHPVLEVKEIIDNNYLLEDTRQCARKKWQLINDRKANLIVNGLFENTSDLKWAIENGYVYVEGDTICPLVVDNLPERSISKRY